jgi:hypothetical protein
MFANALTKPVQGQQFIQERRGLTNWDWVPLSDQGCVEIWAIMWSKTVL